MDPITAAGAKALENASGEASQAISNLIIRAFGPASDVVGQYLAKKTDYQLNNAERIAKKAERRRTKRSKGEQGGSVSPRLSYVMLEEGTYSDDELMAEYLGGVLAAGCTPAGKDDRGVTWTKLVTSMSVLQLRAHFIFYREWAIALKGRPDVNVAQVRKPVELFCELNSLYQALREVGPGIEPNELVAHVLSGLSRLNLVRDEFYAGTAEIYPGKTWPAGVPFEAACRVEPTLAGMELYGWACGLTGIHPKDFHSRPELTDLEIDIPRPQHVLPFMPPGHQDHAVELQ